MKEWIIAILIVAILITPSVVIQPKEKEWTVNCMDEYTYYQINSPYCHRIKLNETCSIYWSEGCTKDTLQRFMDYDGIIYDGFDGCRIIRDCKGQEIGNATGEI